MSKNQRNEIVAKVVIWFIFSICLSLFPFLMNISLNYIKGISVSSEMLVGNGDSFLT
jgi:hypothetical protein